MAEGTVDSLNIQLSADADQAVKSLNSLASTLRSINTAFTKDISGMRKFSKELGTMTSALRGLNNIKVSAPDLSKISKAMKDLGETKTSGAKNTANDIKDIVNSLRGLGTVNFNESGITKLTNSLRRLTQVDLSTFDASKFRQITDSVSTLGNMPDVSSSVNRLVSSLSRLANAGTKTGQSANDILRLGQQTALAARELGSVGAINDDVNMFVQSIGRLATAGNKTAQTASGLSVLAKETIEFFKAMQNAPKVSQNTIAMTQALAQLASAGGRVGIATNSVTSAFEKLSRAGTSTMNALKKAASGIVSALQRITGAGKGVDGVTLSLRNLLGTAIGFNVGYGLLNFGKSMFELGSDVTEVENVVDVAFGGMAQSAYDFAKTAQEQFGLSELTALRYSGTMMSVLNASGVAQRDAAEMSTTLAGLAGDLASFYNISQDNAWEKIMSGMSGEIEPLRRLGINMSVANLQAYALSQGITESWQSMSQAEQVMLRYNYLMQASAQQQGDFARTSGTYANQVRLLTLNIQQLAATLGQGLISAVLPAITALNKLFAVLQKAAVAVRNFFYVLTGYEGGGSSDIVNDLASIGDASTGLEDLGSSGSDAADGLGDAAKAAEELKNATLGIDELNIISPNESTPTGGSGGSGGGGGAGGVGGTDLGLDDGLLDLGGKKPEEYVSPWAEAIRKAFLAEDWEELGSVIAEGLNRGLQKVYDVLNWDNVGPKITAFTTAFTQTFNSFAENFDFDLLGRTIGAGINTVVNTLNQLIDGIDWVNLGNRFAVGFNGLVDEVDWFELGRLIGNKFMIAWDTLLGFVTTLDWGEVGRSLADGFNGIFSEISLGDIGTTIGTIVAGIIEMFREFFANADWSEVANQVKEGITNALEAASDGGKNDGILAGVIGIGALAGISQIIGPVVTTIEKLSKAIGGKGLSGSFKDLLKNTGGKAGISGIFTSLKTAISGISAPVGIAAGAVALIVAGVIDLWNTSETFRDSVSDIWDKISDAFSEAKIAIWDNTILPLWENLQDFFGSLYGLYESSGLKQLFEDILVSFGTQIADNFSYAIGVLSTAFETIGGVASGIIEILTGVIDFVTGIFSGDWEIAWSGVETIIDGVCDAIGSLFGGLWETIKKIFSPVISFFDENFSKAHDAVTTAWENIGKWFQDKWNLIKTIFSPVVIFFRTNFTNAYNAVKNAFQSINAWFQDKWNAVKNVFAPVVSFFRTNFTNAYNAVKNAFQSIGSWFSDRWTDIKNVFSSVSDTFRSWFQNARNNVNNIWSSIGSWFRDRWNDIKNVFSSVSSFFSDAFTNAANAVKNAFNGIGRKFEDIADQILNPIRNAVNSIIDGVNWVIDSLGVGSKLSHWGYARGSNGIPRDTFGVVNDQKGATYRELIVPPNGKPFIPKGRNVMLPLPKGTKILPANETKKFMKNMPHFKFGIGDLFGGAWESIKNFTGDIWDYVSNPKKIAQMAIDNFMDLSGMVQPWLRIAGGIANKLLGSIVDFVSNLFDQAVPQINYDPSAGAEQWRPLAKKALQMTGQYTEANLDRLIMQMSTESGGNPNAINNWDINAKNGTPSKGLMQVIDPTFNAYKYPGYDDIWDPLSNILAAIRYTVSRYGSLAKGWQGHGYAEGIGTITISDFFKRIPKLAGGGTVSPGQLFIANERGPELIGRYGNRSTVVNNNQVVDSVSIGVEKAFERQNIEIVYLLNQILETNQRILSKNQTITMNGKRVGREIDRSRRNAGYQFSPT